jgi:hypothetical protein
MDTNLSEKQIGLLNTLIKDYLDNGKKIIHDEEVEEEKIFDEKRIEVMKDLKKLITDFQKDSIHLDVFKIKVDGINKKNRLWGFRGMSGQMFFNIIYNLAQSKKQTDKLNKLLKNCIKLPKDLNEAKEKIISMNNFINELGKDVHDKRSAPRNKSSLYFLSYFWQIQNETKFPVFYFSNEKVLLEYNILTTDPNLDEYYERYYRIMLFIKDLSKSMIKKEVSLWFIEHVLWYHYNTQMTIVENPKIPKKSKIIEESSELDFIPMMLQDFHKIAMNDKNILESYSAKNKDIVTEFENKCYVLFTMLGYKSIQLGQGSGREPDGIALSEEHHYAIIYDAKIRTEKEYTIGTEDRKIKEYIQKYMPKLKKRGFDKIYYLIISSGFRDSYEDIIQKLRLETGINSVSFISAENLLLILSKKLRNPTVDLGLDFLQKIFSIGDVIDQEIIVETLDPETII